MVYNAFKKLKYHLRKEIIVCRGHYRVMSSSSLYITRLSEVTLITSHHRGVLNKNYLHALWISEAEHQYQ